MTGGLGRVYGLLRSLGIYRANPLFRRRARAFYAGFVRPGDLCFDIGAHLGDRVDAFLALGARVVAVEPQPDLQRLLHAQFGRHPRAVLVAGAVGAAPGMAELLVNHRHPTLSTLSADWIAAVGRDASFPTTGWDDRVTVPVTTLDLLIAEHGLPDFCKIDVEGFEQAVLDGLSRPLPCLSFEYIAVTRDMAVACLERLERLGPYRYNVSPGESKRLLFDGWIGHAALVDWLWRLRPGDGSGDVYARLP